jgi:hypothetical protein
MSVEICTTYDVSCDGCGDMIYPEAESPTLARQYARDRGWQCPAPRATGSEDGGQDYCPKCKERQAND